MGIKIEWQWSRSPVCMSEVWTQIKLHIQCRPWQMSGQVKFDWIGLHPSLKWSGIQQNWLEIVYCPAVILSSVYVNLIVRFCTATCMNVSGTCMNISAFVHCIILQSSGHPSSSAIPIANRIWRHALKWRIGGVTELCRKGVRTRQQLGKGRRSVLGMDHR